MAKHYRLSVHDLNGNKLCTLYDSRIEQIGSAKSIKITKEIEGWKEIEFTISKRDAEGNRNYRFDYLKNENLLYLYENGALDVYCIKAPSKSHSSGKVQVSVTCNHLSEELKAKNLFKYFDDENGIDTCENLIQKAIAGTGWTLIACDKFFESDGVTEKIRSYKCDAKTGAWNMIAEICKLFKAHPIFHGADRTIEIRSNDDSTGWKEILFGKNSDKLTRTEDSSNMISRLYVEGEYGDYGYVGIDSVNPTGLPFLLNFDYYKELGVFTSKHQAAVDKYLKDYKENSTLISESTSEMLKATSSLSELIGICEYVYYPVVNGAIDMDNIIHSNGIENAKTKLNVGDRIAIVAQDGSYSYGEYANGLQLNGVICVLKFIPTITGTMAAHEDIISSSSDSIERYLEELNKFLADEGYATVSVSDLHSIYNTENLSIVKSEGFNTNGLAKQYALNTTLEYVYSIGMSENVVTASYASLNKKMLQVIDLVQQIDNISKVIEIEIERQGAIDNEFSIAMGAMLRDGYWSDDNYTIGQEEFLYKDALDMAAIVCRPTVAYSIDTYNLSVLPEFADESFELGNTVRIYEPELDINDYAIVSKTVECPDKPTSDTATLKTDLLDIGAKTFSTVLERVTELAEQVRQNRDIYQRAVAISKDGTINSNLLNGAIDVLKTRLLSTSSNWTTDDKGNIIFTALDGSSAMMLCGGGFMIANTKKANGEWNWRTFGTGEGFTADLIVAGFINAERIQAHTITVDHLMPNVGNDIDISKNSSITLTDERISLIVSSESTSSNVILTDKAIQAIADKITFTANQEITFTVGDAKFSIDAEAFNSLIGNSSNYTSLQQQADGIAVVAVDENGNISSIDFTPHAIMAMSESIILTADKISAIANDIDLSGNHTITFNTEQLKAIANNINLETNVSIRQMVSGRSKIFYQEAVPEEYEPGDAWIVPSTGKTYHAVGLPGGSATEIVVNDDFEFVFRYPPDAEGLDFLIGQYGDLLSNTEYADLDDEGTLYAFRDWVEVPVSELHTSYIDIMQDVIRIRSGGNIEIGAGGAFNVDAGSAHFKTSDFALSILAEDGSEDTVLDFDAGSKTLRADEVKAGNIRDFFPGTTTVTAAEIGGLDGLAGMLAAAQYEHVVYMQTTSDASSEVIEFNACDSMMVEIEGFAGCVVPPLAFNRLTGRMLLKNLSWNCPDQTALCADSGNVMLRRCTADAQTGVHATGSANVVWIGDDEAMTAGGACTTAFLADEGADVKLFGLIPSGERTKTLAGTITEINVRTGAGVEVDHPDKTVTIKATLGYYGTGSGWNGGAMYQGYTSGKGRIYGCMQFDLPDDIAQIKAATLTLHRASGAGSGSNINVTVYESATGFKNRPSLGDQVAHRDKAAGTGESCTLDVTEGAKALLDGTAKQLVLYTGESAAASGVVYSRHYGKFDSAKLKITY